MHYGRALAKFFSRMRLYRYANRPLKIAFVLAVPLMVFLIRSLLSGSPPRSDPVFEMKDRARGEPAIVEPAIVEPVRNLATDAPANYSAANYSWDPALVEPVRMVPNAALPANVSLNLRLGYPADSWGDMLHFKNHSTVLWSIEPEGGGFMGEIGARRAKEEDFADIDGFDLVVDTAVAMEVTQSNIQHFIFEDLQAIFAYIYLRDMGIDDPEVVIWPVPSGKERVHGDGKWSFQQNVLDLLAPDRNHMLLPSRKVLIKKALYVTRDRGLFWRGHEFEWRKNLKGTPPVPFFGHIQVVLDELRRALPRDFAALSNKTTGMCLPREESAKKMFLERIGLHGLRVLRNTAEYEQLLESMGYTRWNPMQCTSLTERWEALRKAEAVVMQFGSDLCNVLWMQRGATVINIVHPGASYIDKSLPRDWNYGFFESMAEALGIHHEGVFAGERRESDHDVIAVREGHSFQVHDGSVVYVNKSNPKAEPSVHGLIVKVPAQGVTHIDGKPFSKINISRSTTVMEQPGAAFSTYSYGMDWVRCLASG
uniref:Glycosyltransferase 61 catalytic domain-containing protein n=1 Tax=Lotharella oceanica TaxID=641309 RepID=A0A7S2U1C1_9EUKA|mmetsp:Transcript_3728/g.7179  ORF Transcript_3728/g.7179 Transcript_3728/m.7179 type:complete len:538 (+) Transcript_3728:245-1858(+)